MKNNKALIIFFAAVFLFIGTLIGSIFHNQEAVAEGKTFSVEQINLVSSVDDVAKQKDEKLTDAWGVEFGHKGRIWVNNSSGFSTVYNDKGEIVKTKDVDGQAVPLAVKVPVPEGNEETAPLTGMVFSDKDDFSGDSFVFVTEHGIIAGWHKQADGFEPLDATVHVDNSAYGAVYKGVTSAKTKKGWQLFAANFSQNKIDVFNTDYEPIKVSGDFKDPDMPKDFAPFNIKTIDDEIYVTYAKQGIDKQNDVKGEGNGYIDVFDFDGKLIKRLINNGSLNSPWGIALAPKDFGELSNDLLVGNFGDGHINVFDPEDGKYIGSLTDEDGEKIQIDGLWSLTFGTDNGAGKHNELFFAAGPSAEEQGLFGKIVPVKGGNEDEK